MTYATPPPWGTAPVDLTGPAAQGQARPGRQTGQQAWAHILVHWHTGQLGMQAPESALQWSLCQHTMITSQSWMNTKCTGCNT